VPEACCICSLEAREDLISAGEGGNARRLMDAAAAEGATRANGIGDVDANADPWRESMLPTVGSEHALHFNRTADRRRSGVERDEESITGMVDLVAVVLHKELAQCRVVPAKEVCPRLVA
jgi:hypothetical protein